MAVLDRWRSFDYPSELVQHPTPCSATLKLVSRALRCQLIRFFISQYTRKCYIILLCWISQFPPLLMNFFLRRTLLPFDCTSFVSSPIGTQIRCLLSFVLRVFIFFHQRNTILFLDDTRWNATTLPPLLRPDTVFHNTVICHISPDPFKFH